MRRQSVAITPFFDQSDLTHKRVHTDPNQDSEKMEQNCRLKLQACHVEEINDLITHFVDWHLIAFPPDWQKVPFSSPSSDTSSA
jgi:hypothetical protein